MGLVRLLGAWLCVAHRNFICTGIGSECLAAILAAVHLVPVDGDATRSWAAHVDFKRTLSALSHVTAGSVAKNACLIQVRSKFCRINSLMLPTNSRQIGTEIHQTSHNQVRV